MKESIEELKRKWSAAQLVAECQPHESVVGLETYPDAPPRMGVFVCSSKRRFVVDLTLPLDLMTVQEIERER